MKINRRFIPTIIRKARGKVRLSLNGLLPNQAPEFIIVGAQKAGTTSLHAYLSQSVKLLASFPKEVNYFATDQYYDHGKDWYHKHFTDVRLSRKRPVVAFDASPNYLYRRKAARRIFEYDPGVKIIILLREPVSRAYSAWNMFRDFLLDVHLPYSLGVDYDSDRKNPMLEVLYGSGEFPSFEKCVDREIAAIAENTPHDEPSFVRRGIYCDQLERYFELFPREQILILGFKELFPQNLKDTLDRLSAFVGIDIFEGAMPSMKVKNKRPYTEPISPATVERLTEFYAPHNQKLHEMLGTELHW